MINFGTSAYLRVLALNPKPRDSELRKRLKPGEGGYDFHKKMRNIAARYAAGKIQPSEIQSELATIARLPERNSAAQAINQLTRWLRGRRIVGLPDIEAKYVSPSSLFSVRFTPDLIVEDDNSPVHLHLWNTMRPMLSSREAIGTLGLFTENLGGLKIGILCLRTRHLYALEEGAKAGELSRLLANDIEKRIHKIITDGRIPDALEERKPAHR